MDLPKHYRFVKDHDKSLEIHDSRDGQRFHIYKKDVHPANQLKIMKLQKFDKGSGDVEPEEVEGYDSGISVPHLDVTQSTPNKHDEPSVLDDLNVIPNQMPGRDQFGQIIQPDNQAAEAPSPELPQAPSEMASPSPTATIPMATGPTARDVNSLEAQKIGGVNAEAKGLAAQNEVNAKLLASHVQALQARDELYNKNIQSYQAQADKIASDIASSKMDPNHYWHDKSVGSKVLASIGVMLGGLTIGAQSNGHNAALDYINKQIDNDITSQKENLGVKQSLLSNNLRLQGNLMQAEQATRLQMSAVLQGQLAQSAAQTGNPIIMARAQQQIADIKMRDLPLKQSLAQADVWRQMLQGTAQSGNAEQRIAMLSQTPKEFDDATKELQAVKNHASQKAAILDAFDRAAEQNTVLGRTGRLGQEPPAMKGFKTLMMPYLKDAEGRINEMELQRTDAMLKDVTDRPSSVKEKRADLVKFLDEKAPSSGHLIKMGINPEQFSPKPQAKTKTVNGVTYMRGPKGEAIPVK